MNTDRAGAEAFQMRSHQRSCASLWCGEYFEPRRDGGKAQRFCRETCRRSFDAAGRRWIAGAIATGMLTVDTLRNGPAATRALLPGDILPLPNIPAEKFHALNIVFCSRFGAICRGQP